MRKLLFLCIILSAISLYADKTSYNISVSITGLRQKGTLRIILFNSKRGFPTQPKKGLKTAEITVKKSVETIVFKDLKKGEYAIAVYHDGNGKLDSNWIGIPTEGTGVSRQKSGFPKFKKSKFMLDREKEISIKVRYR